MVRKAAPKRDTQAASAPPIEAGGVFISHVHEDEPLAEAFETLIADVTGGVVPTYRSTAKQFGKGIQYGEEWFKWICEGIEKARHIVALLTPASTGRPWILFEAGLGKAKSDNVVFGVGLGIKREDAYKGPFAALQNCGTDEEELVKLCHELLEGTAAKPRDQMIKRCVGEFRAAVDKYFASQKPGKEKGDDPTTVAVFQALEEMKLMIRDQGRFFEADSPRRIIRSEREYHHTLMMLRELPFPETAELHLTLLAGAATQFGMFWARPMVDFLVGSEDMEVDNRCRVVIHMLRNFGEDMHRGFPSKMGFMLADELDAAVHRYMEYRMSFSHERTRGETARTEERGQKSAKN